MSTSTVSTSAPARASRLGTISVVVGGVAAALTMILSFVALALAVVAVATGGTALRRGGGPAAGAGVALGAVVIYLVVLEIAVLG